LWIVAQSYGFGQAKESGRIQVVAKNLLFMLVGAGLVLVIIGSYFLIQNQRTKNSVKGVEVELSDTPPPTPIIIPTETPIPSLIPTNKPVYIKPSTTPTANPKKEAITILSKTYQCELDGVIEIRDMMFKYDQVASDFIACLKKCDSDGNENTCGLVCKNRSLSEGKLYSANLGSLIDQYCKK